MFCFYVEVGEEWERVEDINCGSTVWAAPVPLPCSRRLYLPCVMRKAPIVEAGEYSVCVGASRPDSRSVKLMGQAPAKRKVCQIQKAILDL